jgi:tetratricopeptide (TPR) repeat protein
MNTDALSPPADARRQAAAILNEWAEGAPPDARAALGRHPKLLDDKSIVLDLAYEEYCQRYEAGERPDTEEFCARFPAYRSSLGRLIAGHRFLEGQVDVLKSAPLPVWPMPGHRLGNWVLRRELGHGAFARVFLADDTAADRPVVLKLTADPGTEARTLGSLSHPNIVPLLHTTWDESGLTIVCMPFLGAATLHDLLDRSYRERYDAPPPRAEVILRTAAAATPGDPAPMPSAGPDDSLNRLSYVDGVARLAEQLADALDFLHRRGVVHRDLKPSNILLDAGGRPQLLDFNLSADARLAPPRIGGTLPYMAPEQARAFIEPGPEPGPRADLFALGVILFELLTGRHPFGQLPPEITPEEAPRWLLQRQRQRPSLRALNPQVDAALASLIERCLAIDPAHRPASAAVVATTLRWRRTPAARLARWAASPTGFLCGTAVSLLLLLLAVGFGWIATMREREEDREYRRGVEALKAGDARAADEHFQRALRSNPNHRPSRLGRARSLLALEQYGEAVPFFEQLDPKHRDGEIQAYLAYCYGLRQQTDPALLCSDRALKAGQRTPATLNNHAVFCILKGGRQADAREAIRQALAIDPNLAPARYHRAYLAYLDWTAQPDQPLTGQTLDDILFALEHCPDYPDVLTNAARILAACATSENDALADRVVSCLERAREGGFDVRRIGKEKVFERHGIMERKDFRKLLDDPPPAPRERQRRGYLCDPLPGLPD